MTSEENYSTQIWDVTNSQLLPNRGISQSIVSVTSKTKEDNQLIEEKRYRNDSSGLSYYVKSQAPVPIGRVHIRLETNSTNRLVDYVYDPFKSPTPTELREYYKRIEFDYSSQVKPYWVLHHNKVWMYAKKNGGKSGDQITLLDPHTKHPFSPSLGVVESNGGSFYLNIPCPPEETSATVVRNLRTEMDMQSNDQPKALDNSSTTISTTTTTKPNNLLEIDEKIVGGDCDKNLLSKQVPRPRVSVKGDSTIQIPDGKTTPDGKTDLTQQIDYLIYLLKAFRIAPSNELFGIIQESLLDLDPS